MGMFTQISLAALVLNCVKLIPEFHAKGFDYKFKYRGTGLCNTFATARRERLVVKIDH